MELNIDARALLNDVAHDRVWRSGGLDWRSKTFPGNCGRYPDRVKLGRKLVPLLDAGYAVLRKGDRYKITTAGTNALASANAVRSGRTTLQAA